MQIEISTALSLLEAAVPDAGQELVRALAAEVDRLQTIEKAAQEYAISRTGATEDRVALDRLCRLFDIDPGKLHSED